MGNRAETDAGGEGRALPLDPADIDTAEVTRRLSRRMRMLIGPGRRWSYNGVSYLTGIDVRSLQAYARGETCPNLAKYKRLLSVMGPELSVDIDQMYGWKPRASAAPPERLDLKSIADDLTSCLEIIDAAIERVQKG